MAPSANGASGEGAPADAPPGPAHSRRFDPLPRGHDERVARFGRKTGQADGGGGGETRAGTERDSSFLPTRGGRPGIESLFMRVVATGGIIGIGTALAAILGTQDVDAWIVGLVVSVVTVVLAAILWSSRLL